MPKAKKATGSKSAVPKSKPVNGKKPKTPKPVRQKLPDFPVKPPEEEKPEVTAAQVLAKILKSKSSGTDIKEIALAFDRYLEGADGFVRLLMEEMDGIKQKGSMARMRIIQMIWQIMKFATPPDAVGDLSLLSDEDIVKVGQSLWDNKQERFNMKKSTVPGGTVESSDHYII